MPKLYEYLGIYVYFYAGDHMPIHVHGYYQGSESKAEIYVENDKVTDVRLVAVSDAPPLPKAKQRAFEKLVRHEAENIVRVWNEFRRTGTAPKAQIITRKIK
jgi:hypothetical protein